MFRFISIITGFLTIIASSPALAYRLSDCKILDEERNKTAKEVLFQYQADYNELAKSIDVIRLKQHKRNTKLKLAPRERKAAKQYSILTQKIKFWEQISDLKNSLHALHGISPAAEAFTEADIIAKDVIETLYALSQKWRIGSSALLTNFLINVGVKEKGFCYHYVAALRKVLFKKEWNQYDIRWGTAWENTFRENNALVITAKGGSFEDGLAIDAWRTAGRPFWTKIKGDRFPWVEVFDAETKYKFE